MEDQLKKDLKKKIIEINTSNNTLMVQERQLQWQTKRIQELEEALTDL